MEYISTRGHIEPVSFKEAVMMGLAADGGLILPNPIPTVDPKTLEDWKKLSYPELALEIMELFVNDIPGEDLKALIVEAYRTFDTPEVTPVVDMGKFNVLELFHGPTLAFKDIALQFLGNLFSYILRGTGETMNILGATSGDTGSAAIYGVRGKDNINIFILHPHGRVSEVQALQMTTVSDKNVFNIAVEGTFDDCQSIVKAIFNQLDFKARYRLASINSINWARVLAQIVYYVFATLKLEEQTGSDICNFSVPTGNFGDIFAGYLAKRMIRPKIGRLILGTNENNILTRFILEGRYVIGDVVSTISPSMDIQIASNFERYLFYLYDQDAERVRFAMEQFEKEGIIKFSREERSTVRNDFASVSIDQASTLSAIRDIYQDCGYILDPHTAVGVAAALRLAPDLPEGPAVCLATAHPAKFPDAVRKAIGREPDRPDSLKGIELKSSRCKILPADIDEIKKYIEKHAI
ncbi:MAG TPA: threonine synthase [Thermodesulfobacteriaceae bacterium]|nr:threonine synthase [Thermodesulfobacteriaceae bacterium]